MIFSEYLTKFDSQPSLVTAAPPFTAFDISNFQIIFGLITFCQFGKQKTLWLWQWVFQNYDVESDILNGDEVRAVFEKPQKLEV